MRYYPRCITVSNKQQLREVMQDIGCDSVGMQLMMPKGQFKQIYLPRVPVREANLLKQTLLAKGGEVAIARGCAAMDVQESAVLIMATVKQMRAAIMQLKLQPWGLPRLALEVEQLLTGTGTRDYSWSDRSLNIGHRTLVMGILNRTPDSFSDGGKYNQMDHALAHAEQMVADGADLIDIGGESTRPYGDNQAVDAQTEIQRVIPVIEQLTKRIRVPISIDTYKAETARVALASGAHIINDVWGLQKDHSMAKVAAESKAPIIVMHNQTHTDYHDLTQDVYEFLGRSIDIALQAGIERDKIMVDPGIGFGKIPADNLVLMRQLSTLQGLGCPILLGTSRKRFIGDVLSLPVDERVEGTAATVAYGITQGVQIVRVHDVKEIVRVVRMMDAMMGKGDGDGRSN